MYKVNKINFQATTIKSKSLVRTSRDTLDPTDFCAHAQIYVRVFTKAQVSGFDILFIANFWGIIKKPCIHYRDLCGTSEVSSNFGIQSTLKNSFYR